MAAAAALRVSEHVECARILVVDDDEGLHGDYDRALREDRIERDALDGARQDLFGTAVALRSNQGIQLDIVHAYRGESAVELVRESLAEGRRFSLAFVDMRMPPGCNGIETIKAVWSVDPAVHVVLCTAYSDFTWATVLAEVGTGAGIHLMRKPFDAEQVRVFAQVLAKKWLLAHTRPRLPSFVGG
ncbi:MAG TPA: response regulator [Nannocystaceae bacterium]|nr:response regulator [Nannocystaceae bacterium]